MPTVPPVTPIILAAGDSMRMGYPKALLPFGPDIFLTHILRVLRNVGMPKPLIILGKTASTVQEQLGEWTADVRINPNPGRGQLSSIQLGLSHLNPESLAGMIWPVDQPAVSEDLIRRLIQVFIDSESKIALPKCGSKRGHPAIFHRSLFQEFMDAPVAESPKKILLRHQDATIELLTNESAVIHDIDTPEDYEALTGESLAEALARTKSLIIP